MGQPLTLRALNRSLLARQGLLERSPAPLETTIERLVGLQAQVPANPYVALWSRTERFDPSALSALVEDGRAVRAGLMRATIHLVTAGDHDALQPVMADVLARTFRSQFARTLGPVGLDDVVVAGRPLLPATRAELGAQLAPRFPAAPAASLGHAVVHHLPIVQTPPRGLWGRGGQARWALRAPAGAGASVDEIVLRYLAAFGPATVADIRTWSGLTGLRAVVDRLRPGLVAVRDEAGRELLDVPGAPYPDPDTPAPPRLLPEYDNVLLSHADRTRAVAERVAPPEGTWKGTLFVDGFTAAGWSVAGDTLTVDRPVPAAEREAIAAEAEGLIRLITPDADPRVAFGGGARRTGRAPPRSEPGRPWR